MSSSGEEVRRSGRRRDLGGDDIGIDHLYRTRRTRRGDCVVHDDVESTMGVDRVLDRRLHVGLDGDVAPNEACLVAPFPKHGCGRFAVLGSAGCDHDRRSCIGEGAGDTFADTLASAGHDRDLVGEQSGHPGIQRPPSTTSDDPTSGAAVPLASHSMMGAMSSVSSGTRPRGGSWRALSAAIPAASCAARKA